MEESLKSEKIHVERKQFFFDLKENPRGRFLRITEDVNGRRDSIILPMSGLADFRAVLDQMIQFNAHSPDDKTGQPDSQEKK
ncbi:MAG: PUR family DNA/RNA-binding protein [Verrucomicrobia bacterium]|nr:PUR family DNA/RNA-binding protein [Verrucomicrobiota bacterium]